MTKSVSALFMEGALGRGAATLTKVRMRTTFRALEAHAKKGRFGVVTPQTLTEKQFRSFVAARVEAGITARVVQLEVSHIRRALEGVGRATFAQKTCSAAALAVPKGTRKGEGRAVDVEVYAAAVAGAPADVAGWFQLQRALGLRIEEVTQSHKSLKEWERDLVAGRSFVIVRHGTKGGKRRDTTIPQYLRERALEAVRLNIATMKERVASGAKYLVDSKNGVSASRLIARKYREAGLVGQNSSHSLRRAYAVELYGHYRQEGFSDKEALAMLSVDMGHGEGRGRWAYNNYLRMSFEGA